MIKNKPPLSVIVLTKNEATRVGEAIESVAGEGWEIIVVDQNSVDNTVILARTALAHIIVTQEVDFSKLREMGAQEATSDWIFYLDADERVSDKLKIELKNITQVKPKIGSPKAYFVRRQNYYLGEKWQVGDRIERLFWKPDLRCWIGELHESPLVDGEVSELIHPIVHFTHRSLSEMIDKTNRWSNIEANLRLRAHHPKVVEWRLFRVMISGFLGSYLKEGGWRMGTVGMIESIFQAFSIFITYAKLWELQKK